MVIVKALGNWLYKLSIIKIIISKKWTIEIIAFDQNWVRIKWGTPQWQCSLSNDAQLIYGTVDYLPLSNL